MTELGLGLAALGRPAYINAGHGHDLGPRAATPESLEQQAHLVLDAAYASGIRYMDAARSYGYAEAFLASWLARTGHDVEVGSKWGYTYVGDWRVGPGVVHEVKDHSLGALRRQYAETRAVLGDHLDLYQIHSATRESGVLDDQAVLDELRRIRDADGIAIGLTVSGPNQAEVIRDALERDVFSTVQGTWNLLEPSAGPALADAAAAGWRVIVKEAMANGRLAADGPAAARLALAAALAQPWATIVLSGATTVAQLAENVEARSLAETPADYWARRAQLPWT
jgi:aryl-alcohol dehydrogenase-like predicted oxidoreductase